MFSNFEIRGCTRTSRYWFYLPCQNVVLSKAKLNSITTQIALSKYFRSAPVLEKSFLLKEVY